MQYEAATYAIGTMSIVVEGGSEEHVPPPKGRRSRLG